MGGHGVVWIHRGAQKEHGRPGLPADEVLALANGERRPVQGGKLGQPNRDGREKAQGNEGGTSRLQGLLRQDLRKLMNSLLTNHYDKFYLKPFFQGCVLK